MSQLPPGFQLDGGAAPAPARAPGIIQGRPKAPEMTTPVQAAQLDMEAQRLQIAQQKAAMEATEFQQKQAKQDAGIPRDINDVRSELMNVIGKAGQARRKSNEYFATGFGADTAGSFGGTNARDVQSLLDTIGGNIAFDRLARMRAESPTGGALGNVTERELTLLQSTVAGLDKTQSDEQFRQSMDDVITSYGRVLAKLPGTDANAVLTDMLKNGATIEELDALASGMGISYNRDALEANIRSRDEGGPISGFVPAPDDPGNGGGSGGGGVMSGLAQGVGDIVQGVGDTVGMITDPFARVLSDALGYDGSQMQSLGTVVREGAGLPQNQNETAGAINRFAASGLVGGLAARAAAPLAQAGGVAQNALSTLGRTPIRDAAAGAGAGAGSQIGQEIGGTPGAIAGGLIGGLGGFGAANALVRGAAPRAPNAYAQAAARQGVDMLPADAGGPIARAVTTGTRASPLSVAPVVNAAERQQQQFGQSVQRTAASQGEVVSTQQAGDTVRQGAERYTKETAQRGSRMYDRAADMARGVRIKPTRTIEAVDGAIARMRENPATSPADIASLEAFRANIEGAVSIQGMRDARTALSQGIFDGKLRSGSEQAMWKGIVANVAEDIDAGLRSVGRENAANAFRTADKFWSERVEFIDQALQPLLGRDGTKGGEQVLQALESMARGQQGGNARLSRVMAALTPEEAGTVRATLVDRIGRATPGAQDAQGEVFSPATFLTNWNKMTPQAKASLFPDKGARADMNDLALIAERSKRGQSMANTSNTGVAIGANVAVGVSGAVANLPLTILGGGATYLTGKLMASPGFARVLARTAKMPPEAANRTFREQIGVLATREPSLQGDINALLQSVNDNAPRLAADQNNEQQ